MNRSKIQSQKGFTLIEALVSVSLFALVMLVSTSSVFTIVEANKKSHSLKSVMTNLNFALESMSRDIQLGSRYELVNGVFEYKANRDVDEDNNYDVDDNDDLVTYFLEEDRIMKQISGQDAFPITAKEIKVTHLNFLSLASGSARPKVTIVIRGYGGVGNTRSDFTIQTTVSQRPRQ